MWFGLPPVGPFGEPVSLELELEYEDARRGLLDVERAISYLKGAPPTD